MKFGSFSLQVRMFLILKFIVKEKEIVKCIIKAIKTLQQ